MLGPAKTEKGTQFRKFPLRNGYSTSSWVWISDTDTVQDKRNKIRIPTKLSTDKTKHLEERKLLKNAEDVISECVALDLQIEKTPGNNVDTRISFSLKWTDRCWTRSLFFGSCLEHPGHEKGFCPSCTERWSKQNGSFCNCICSFSRCGLLCRWSWSKGAYMADTRREDSCCFDKAKAVASIAFTGCSQFSRAKTLVFMLGHWRRSLQLITHCHLRIDRHFWAQHSLGVRDVKINLGSQAVALVANASDNQTASTKGLRTLHTGKGPGFQASRKPLSIQGKESVG